MLKKILLWTAALVTLLLLAAVGAIFALDRYLNTHEEKLLHEWLPTAGLEVAFRRVDVRLWDSFPRVTVAVDSLVLRDTLRPADVPPLLTLQRFRTEFSVAELLHDSIELRNLDLSHGRIHLATDSAGYTNTGLLFDRDTTAPASPPKFHVKWDGLTMQLTDIDVVYLHAPRRKHLEAHLNSVRGTGRRAPRGGVDLCTEVDLHVAGLAFNTDKGAYLTDSRVSGELDVRVDREGWNVAPTRLRIGDQFYEAAAHIAATKGEPNQIRLRNDSTDYLASRALLPRELQEKLSEYTIRGRFPVRAEINSTFQRGENPEVNIDFRLTGQDVQLKGYAFRDAKATGHFVNRLDEAAGGIPGSRKNLRFDLDSVSAYQGRLHITMPRATVMSSDTDTRLLAPVRVSGPASAVSQRLKNRDFFFDRGRFAFTTEADVSLLASMQDLLTASNGILRFSDIDVVYEPADVRFPFAFIQVGKSGQDIGFHLHSGPLPTGVSFELMGNIDNLTPLLFDRPGEQIHTDVTLLAPRIAWEDFRSFFGQDGVFPTDTVSREEREVQSMKTALLGLQNTFRPRVDARIDTVAYYDVFTLHDLRTGLYFAADTLILDRTSFDWAGSQLAFGARLDLGQAGRTPFDLLMQADHLNLNRLRPTLDYFGPQLPAELDTLPDDLSIRFAHRGIIEDTVGISPDHNSGSLAFDDGRDRLFSGELTYQPGPLGIESHTRLRGDPLIVNTLFRAEDFFFGTGNFTIDLDLQGTPANMEELIRTGRMQLRIDSSRVEYRPGQIYVPIRRFAVDVEDERARYHLELFSDSIQRSVEMSGELDRLTGFLFPESGRGFSVRTDARAASLHWSDLNQFVRPEKVDTSDFDLQSWVSATGGVFNTFRPNLSLAIDTFWTGRQEPILDLYSGLRLRDSTQLILENSGFTLGEGRVQFAATYALDDRQRSPFTLEWHSDSLSLEQLVDRLGELDFRLPDGAGKLRGRLSMSGFLDGQLDEGTQQIVYDRTRGTINYALTDMELVEWPLLTNIGRKAFMEKRFRHLRFAPLRGEIRLDSGRAVIPRMEVQSTGFQVFVEGEYDLATGPDLLISLPLRNIGRGTMDEAPEPTGYARSGWKVYLLSVAGKEGKPKMKFRLGRRRYFKDRGRLQEFLELRAKWREERRAARRR
ncbi:AsmA-like C-terminal region-containing protein [Lewinella sp. JB7]|uniref:AsmA-like C-terminal region-containing protein n=1 Tax=Lewinella sp. JB7 TaxID=2962887 RepID=UPI0020C95523|nr:AsmA-like C-terminal region-containing protein [Lewinella sp. JB7]MCP9234843.1 AsmA-like C-terminal region-containing protein [Lewinella sp. JB7]